MEATALDARWRALAEKAVGGFLDALRSTTDDGLVIEPLYPRSTVDTPRPWRRAEAWSVSQRVDHPDPGVANRSALLDLEGGANALTLACSGSPFARGFGLPANATAIRAALDGVELDLISMRLDAGSDTLAATSALADLVADRRLTSAALDIDLGFDPVGQAARTGDLARTSEIRNVADINRRAGLGGRVLLADGRPYHEAGAGEAQELAAVLATGVAYLRHLENTGMDIAAARDAIAWLVALDADVFLGIAKVRAARRLWARIEAACGLAPKPLRLHVETSWRVMTRFDPWVNVMRATAATAAGGLGGVDAVTVLPMTLPRGLPDNGARRIARNIGMVLIDEAHLAKVDDPAAGSGGLDGLTTDLCHRAWTLFQEIEGRGGIEATLKDRGLQADIAETARKRASELATLRRGMIGTSRFPSLTVPEMPVLDVPSRAEPTKAGALPSIRDAEPFERLRDRADAAAQAGTRPSVFLAVLGTPAGFGPRANLAANFFASGGIATTPPTETLSAPELAARFGESGVPVACLCATDAAYADEGEALVAALRTAGARLILLVAGDEIWRKKGVDVLIHEGQNAIEVLGTTLDALIGAPG